ncbi:MAG: hypothetical protein PHS59_18455 [Paludibacter sp.]|nr:hypothetical protein [Paludibacter sp.]
MREELLNKLPTWYETINADDNFMVLSDDFDSYYSCLELYRHTGMQIGAFYDINSGLYINAERCQGKEPVYVDLSVCLPNAKCFDNHVNCLLNKQAINPNNIGIEKYTDKYNGGTLPLICALYGKDISAMSERHLFTMMTQDSWYQPYYSSYFHESFMKWVDLLFGEDKKYILSILQQNTESDFKRYSIMNKMKAKIIVDNDGYLISTQSFINNSGLDVSCQFVLHRKLSRKYNVQKYNLKNYSGIITAAETKRNVYSICQMEE